MKIPKIQTLKTSDQGFTLIELLVVIGVLGILLAITLIAINPNKHFQDARNTQRSSNVGEVLNAIYEYESANTGNIPPSLTYMGTTALPLGKAATQSPTSTTFAAGAVTFTGLSGNTVTTGNILVSGCANAGNNGELPVTGGNSTTITATDASGVASDTTCQIKTKVDLCTDLTSTYIADIPKDPTTGTVNTGSSPCAGGVTTYDTGYTIVKTASGSRFTIAAPAAEDGATITVTR